MSANKLIELIKKAAIEAVEASDPTRIMYGTVKSINPLKIQIDQKLILEADFLLLTDNVRDYKLEMTVEHKTEKTKVPHTHVFTGVPNSGGPVTGTNDTQQIEHDHEYKGKKIFTVHNALKQGETVILIQAQGSQKFIVLDRVEGRA